MQNACDPKKPHRAAKLTPQIQNAVRDSLQSLQDIRAAYGCPVTADLCEVANTHGQRIKDNGNCTPFQLRDFATLFGAVCVLVQQRALIPAKYVRQEIILDRLARGGEA